MIGKPESVCEFVFRASKAGDKWEIVISLSGMDMPIAQEAAFKYLSGDEDHQSSALDLNLVPILVV